ncbi:AsmA family protein [Magnetospirillum sulfuroxidans]|uniref:AsmA family protein n=1 Tax=Magnetospirillum sulfuroxidans TaxID=611300 RepID=A0ABS5IB75_9PROT|nr:AsmA family protein [Magnetospirillum sulfuroxidans]MBR9971640.1 AsmA family protein [Magnetospirillum sulfuroxidans]
MKKILAIVGVIVVLLIAALVALPSLVPADKIKGEVVAQVKAATGRDLSIQGKVSVSAFPSLGVEVNNVALANPAGFSTKDLIRLGALDVKLKLLPILSGRVEVDSFVLVDPVITLEVDRKGKANWVFDTPATAAKGKPAPAEKTPSPATSASGSGSASGLDDIVLGDVRIQNGKLTYIDGPAGTKEDVDGINLAVSLKSLDAPLAVKGGLNWHAKAIDLGLNVAKPRALLDGKSTDADLSINSETVKLSFKGQANGGPHAGATGALDLSVPSIRALAQWATGKPLAMAGSGLGPLALNGQLAAAGTKISLTQTNIAIDAIKAKGDFNVDTGGARPALKGKLDVEALDLNPYLPADKPAASSAGGSAAPAATAGGKAAKSGWSDDPIDASGLKAADVDFALSVGSITVNKIKVGKSALKLVLNNGRLNADLTELALYQGSGKGKIGLDGSQPGIGLDASFVLKGLQAEPFLTDAADFNRLEGTGNFDVQVSGRGRTERQLVSALNGKGAVSFLDGAIKGINLAEMVRNVTTAFGGGGSAQKTDFAELGGTFTITDGIVRNQDLALKSPLLRVEGKGSVELPPRTVHYRVEPKAVASLEGQGGKADVGGIQVPVIIEGPWENLSYRPDLEAMLKGQAGKAIQDAIGGKAGGLGGLVGGGSGNEQKAGPLPINPGSLFGR